MLNNNTLQNDTNTQNNTFYTDTTRATWTTVGLGVGAFVALLLVYPLWMALLNDAPFKTLYLAYPMFKLYRLLVPLAIAGAYWLALLRLRRVGVLRAWLETVGLSLLYFVGTGALMGVGSYYLAGYDLPPTLYNPWWVFTTFTEVPQMMLFALILVAGCATIALGFAPLFARWHEVRLAHLPGSGWRDFLIVFGVGSVVLLLMGLAFPRLAFASLPENFFILFIVPGAIASILVSWWMYRTMFKAWQNMPATTELAAETKK
jgi:hypothetical protein